MLTLDGNLFSGFVWSNKAKHQITELLLKLKNSEDNEIANAPANI